MEIVKFTVGRYLGDHIAVFVISGPGVRLGGAMNHRTSWIPNGREDKNVPQISFISILSFKVPSDRLVFLVGDSTCLSTSRIRSFALRKF